MPTPEKWKDHYGPWAVVTGASGGIGRAAALLLAEAGLGVVLVARRHAALEALAAEVARRSGAEARIVSADLSDPTGLAAVDRATEGLDVGLFVASAGYGTSGGFLDAALEDELAMVDVNCRALLHGAHRFARRFADRGRGGIVLMSSIVAFQGVPRASSYAATKAFVQTLAEGLRMELGPRGVDVVASAPGPVSSGFGARADMRIENAIPPEVVARQTLRALGRVTTVRPGLSSKVLGWSLLLLPRFFRSLIVGQVMRGMTRHQSLPAAGAGPGVA